MLRLAYPRAPERRRYSVGSGFALAATCCFSRRPTRLADSGERVHFWPEATAGAVPTATPVEKRGKRPQALEFPTISFRCRKV